MDIRLGHDCAPLTLMGTGTLPVPRLRHVPARTTVWPASAAAVKDGPLGPPEGPVLEGREHAGMLVCVGSRNPMLVLDRGEIPDRRIRGFHKQLVQQFQPLRR